MKILTLVDNQWKERKFLQLSEQEKSLMLSRKKEDEEQKGALISDIQNKVFAEASEEESSIAQSIYDNNKIENSDLISAEVFLPDGNGIINCRINGEHKQIRF